ncbi:integrase core domain-containing protein [Microtetraspora sp. NBRC 16547]|uniref:integrase core domain-containing protein n=1 Tax=Microtetraspora sp. NBRC 16547 TaxID=3030993 RepID=UPI0033316DF0
MNTSAEPWVGTVRRECTNRLLVYNDRHLHRVLQVYERHYNRHRPHRSPDRQPPQPPHAPANLDQIRLQRRQILDGVINQYRRAA